MPAGRSGYAYDGGRIGVALAWPKCGPLWGLLHCATYCGLERVRVFVCHRKMKCSVFRERLVARLYEYNAQVTLLSSNFYCWSGLVLAMFSHFGCCRNSLSDGTAWAEQEWTKTSVPKGTLPTEAKKEKKVCKTTEHDSIVIRRLN